MATNATTSKTSKGSISRTISKKGAVPKTDPSKVGPIQPSKPRFRHIGIGGRSRRRKNNRRGSGTRRRRHGKQQSLKSFFHF